MDSWRDGSCPNNFTYRYRIIMTVEFGLLMFLYGMTCIFIGALAVYYVINKIKKTPEQIEQEENEKYLNELKGKL